MTLKELRKTEWSKSYKIVCPSTFNEAMGYALNDDFFVTVGSSDETGKMLWFIAAYETDFWMDSFKTKKEAIDLCNVMNWKVKNAII